MGNELNLMGQIKVIRVARAYITSRLESIQIPEIVNYDITHFHILRLIETQK